MTAAKRVHEDPLCRCKVNHTFSVCDHCRRHRPQEFHFMSRQVPGAPCDCVRCLEWELITAKAEVRRARTHLRAAQRRLQAALIHPAGPTGTVRP